MNKTILIRLFSLRSTLAGCKSRATKTRSATVIRGALDERRANAIGRASIGSVSATSDRRMAICA